MRDISALVAGLLFGIGLWISGMADPARVLGFLDLAGDWDLQLVFVLAGAVGVTLVTFRYVLARPQPLLDERFAMPTRRDVDRPLLLGAAIFGVGWGITGYCPGPAITSLASADLGIVVFVVAMIVGGLLAPRR